jgi:glutathione S-transferase
VAVVLYSMSISHPSLTARTMLDLKQVDYQLVKVTPGAQRVQLRLAGFRGRTVPAIKLDGRRVQGSRAIARALDERYPQPALFPADPHERAAVEEAERWGEEQFQPVPRRLFRYAIAHNPELAGSLLRRQGLPAVQPLEVVVRLIAAYFARTIEADGRRATAAGIRADLAALPAMLDHADRLLAAGTLRLDPPNAAALQVLSTVRTLCAFSELRELVASHACAEPALAIFGRPPQELRNLIPADWPPPVA